MLSYYNTIALSLAMAYPHNYCIISPQHRHHSFNSNITQLAKNHGYVKALVFNHKCKKGRIQRE